VLTTKFRRWHITPWVAYLFLQALPAGYNNRERPVTDGWSVTGGGFIKCNVY